ncbi:MAG TPA: prolyl oligopeptidase family serine peptidase [Opitutaceae bacterium]|jgi:prolyl oligopeptidase|nr:prolyl oligopeptidase family serine peptidase [Opitutaceae bacterium]
MKSLPLFLLGLMSTVAMVAQEADPNLWLEDVTGDRALAWAKAQNEVTRKELTAGADFEAMRQRLLSIYDSKEKIPFVTKAGDYYYNFWRDAQHVRGIWRRTTLQEFRKPDPAWETVLDVDKLAADEKENWYWSYQNMRYPDYTRCLVGLTRGGGDAVVVREFDLVTKSFVKDGFVVPESKSAIDWQGADSLFVGTDFGPGTLTDSGYARVVKSWRRGTPLASATTIFEGQKEDVQSLGYTSNEPGYHREFVYRAVTFYTGQTFLVRDGRLTKLEVPEDAKVSTFRNFLIVTLRKGWSTGGTDYPGGALLAADLDKFLAGDRHFTMLFTPSARISLSSATGLRDCLIVNELDDVKNRLYVRRPQPDGSWSREPMDAPEFGNNEVQAVDPETDDYFLTTSDFLTPTSLYLGRVGAGRELLKQLPSFFNAEGLEVTQHESTSKDGTKVPYFQVSRKGLVLDGSNPTILYGYGGFEVSMNPFYSGGYGSAWLEKGGVFILSNIRGGGEFGPTWHESALKEHRQRAYDDFISVAEDLVSRKITSPRHLGIVGGSNGGLLMGVMTTERPDLFNAVVCQNPLLDMKRYSHLLAGASWMAEYGNPDVPEEWAYISKYSPYQNTRPGVTYPRVLFTTSTRDDRVHPGHARKMAFKMQEQGHDVLFFEQTEGGHSSSATNEQRAYETAITFAFLTKQLK